MEASMSRVVCRILELNEKVLYGRASRWAMWPTITVHGQILRSLLSELSWEPGEYTEHREGYANIRKWTNKIGATVPSNRCKIGVGYFLNFKGTWNNRMKKEWKEIFAQFLRLIKKSIGRPRKWWKVWHRDLTYHLVEFLCIYVNIMHFILIFCAL